MGTLTHPHTDPQRTGDQLLDLAWAVSSDGFDGHEGAIRQVVTAARRSLAISGMRGYWHGEGGELPGVILGYSAPAQHEFSATLAALGGTLTDPGAA